MPFSFWSTVADRISFSVLYTFFFSLVKSVHAGFRTWKKPRNDASAGAKSPHVKFSSTFEQRKERGRGEIKKKKKKGLSLTTFLRMQRGEQRVIF
jgi:hypothetical protein